MKIQKDRIIIFLLWCVSPISLCGQQIEKTIRIEQDYSSRNDVRSIRFDTKGTMWIGTADGILKESSKGAFEWNSSLGSYYVKDVSIDSNDCLWVSSWPGGVHQSTDNGRTWTQIPEFGNMPVMSVLTEKDGDNYVATWGTGIYQQLDKWTKIGKEQIYEKGVNAILKDSDGKMWIATYLGLVRYDEPSDKAEIYTTGNSLLPSNNIYKLARDKQNSLWAGTDRGLINVTKKQIFTTRNSPLPSLSILSLYCPMDRKGIWIGTSKGLAFFNGKKWNIWTTANSELLGDKIQSITEKEGKIYIGTHKGINIMTY